MGPLPDWVRDGLSLVALIFGTPGIILFLLGRKGANRKLIVEESGVTVDQFNAALPAYKDLLDRANKDRDEALAKLSEYKEELDDVRDKQNRLIRLIFTVAARGDLELTPNEQSELEASKPHARHRTYQDTGSGAISLQEQKKTDII